MNIVIFGGGGFIGHHLVERLRRDTTDKIIVVDNFTSNTYPVWFKEHWIDRLKCINIDITDSNEVYNFFRKYTPEVVVNLSAVAGVQNSSLYPEQTIRTNVEGFDNIIMYSRIFDVKRFIYASSSSVYGDTNGRASCETDKLNPKSIYAISKCYNEEIANAYRNNYGLETVGLRFFTVYGEGGRPDMGIYRFIDSIDKGEEIKLYNYGRNYRDFTYVGDIVNAIYRIIYLNKQPSHIYNLGGDSPTMIKDLVSDIENIMERKANIVLEEPKEWDVNITHSNISRAKSELGWCPSMSLYEGLQRTVDWYYQMKDLANKEGIEDFVQNKENLSWTIINK